MAAAPPDRFAKAAPAMKACKEWSPALTTLCELWRVHPAEMNI
jgi:hypothetical protein